MTQENPIIQEVGSLLETIFHLGAYTTQGSQPYLRLQPRI